MIAQFYKISIEKYHTDFSGFNGNFKGEIDEIKEGLVTLELFYDTLRFGSSDLTDNPYIGMIEGIEAANKIVRCKDPHKVPRDFFTATSCFDSEGITYIAIGFINKYYSLIEKGVYIKPNGENLAEIWFVCAVSQYDSFFYPSGAKIVDTITKNVQLQFLSAIGGASGFLFWAIIFSIAIIVVANTEDNTIRFTLRLFLFCPPKSIYNIPQIMTLFTGKKSYTYDDTTQRDSSFYNNIIAKLNDMIITANSDTYMIEDVNASFEKMFDVENDEIRGTNIKDFFTEARFKGITNDLYSKPCDIIYIKNNENVYISTVALQLASHIVIIGRNETARVVHKTLIADEKKRSDALLACILPPSLIPRVQSGEKNISYAVQNASVSFLDIVEFTPWCGSNSPNYVMKVLNNIFQEFDACIATFKSLSKIKCIGDCYMAAGGIFDEISQPVVHAKEMVEFAIKAISIIMDISSKYNEKLKIRIGINTGGPIVAGVLGTDMPTFEILGPTINIAQQMEHHGVPMMIHISRPVYELVYGGNFVIKERGETSIKNGKMLTYLIDPMIEEKDKNH
jgi:guanylate cyclase